MKETPDTKKTGTFLLYSGAIMFLFTVFLVFSGYFEIGLLSDDYLNFAGAQSSSLLQKFTSSVPQINHLHFRPVYYLSINLGIWLNQILGLSSDNFVLFRIENLILFYVFIFLAAFLFFKFTENMGYALILMLMCLLYPNNLNDICWTVGKNDILCGIFLIASLIFTYYYYDRQTKGFYYLTGLFFCFALMTKETSIILPFITLIIFYTAFSREKLVYIKNILVLEFFMLIVYFLYRVYILGVQPSEVVTKFQKPGLFSSAGVIFKSVTSLIIPYDYLSIQEYMRNFNLVFTIYAIVVFIYLVAVLFIFIRTNNFKYLALISLILLIAVSPNLIAGYFRPQLILIPFVLFSFLLLIVALKMSVNVKFYLSGLILILLLWGKIGFNLIQDWKFAYENSKSAVKSLTELDMDLTKRNIIIGLPSRFRQAVISDYVMGAYNYRKYEKFIINDKITDLILTGSLDNESLNSEIYVIKLSDNEYEILTSGTTQYFMKLGGSGSSYVDRDITLKLSQYNKFNKPTKLQVRVNGNDADFYVYSQNGYTKIVDNKIQERSDQ